MKKAAYEHGRRDDQDTHIPLAGMQDRPHPVTERTGGSRQTGGISPGRAGRLQQETGVFSPLIGSGISQYNLITGQLQVITGLLHGDPHQRIKPAKRLTYTQKYLVSTSHLLRW